MAVSKVDIEEFLSLSPQIPILDVRSPSEFSQAHIPNACGFAIFSDEERKIIGTAYKQESREIAIRIGLDAFGKNMSHMVLNAEEILKRNKSATKEVRVHCWRGGMRSAAVAWLLDLYGFKVYLLNGGYKSYRRRVLDNLNKTYHLKVIGGYTGGNKTGLLQYLKTRNENTIDLEGLAGHMGSAFGNLDNVPQPSQEQFENNLSTALEKCSSTNQVIWIEGESQRIGTINIPHGFFKLMRKSNLYFMDIGFDARLQHILKTYGSYSSEKLISATLRITKKLGGLETKNAVNALIEGDVKGAFSILLKYYDKLYLKSTDNTGEGEREIIRIISESTEPEINYKKLIEHGI